MKKAVNRLRYVTMFLMVFAVLAIPLSANATTTKATTKATTKVTTTVKKCSTNNSHSVACGNIGKWFNSKSELHSYVFDDIIGSWNKKVDNGEITREEYRKKCPQGYECWSCSNCGKWTGNYKYDTSTTTTTKATTKATTKVTTKATTKATTEKECKHTWKPMAMSTTGIHTEQCTLCKEKRNVNCTYTQNVINPTCTTEGYTKYTCACGRTYNSDYISATGHKMTENIVPATCTDRGYTQYDCTNCDYSFKGNYTSPVEHIWNNGVITTKPTCTSGGIKTFTCMLCNTTKTENVNKLSHSYTYTDYQPTCTEDGYRIYVCKFCSDTYTTVNDYATGHNYTYISNGDGTHYKHCTKCNDNFESSKCAKINNGTNYICRDCDYIFPKVTTAKPTTSSKVEASSEKTSGKDNTTKNNTTVPTQPSTSATLTTSTLAATDKAKSTTTTKTQRISATNRLPNTSTQQYKPKTTTKKTTTKATTKVTTKTTTKSTNTLIKSLKKGKKKFKVTWKKVSGVTGYQIQYSTSKQFTKKTTKSVLIKSNKTVSTTVKKLKSNKKYYVRIRTYKNVKVKGKTVKVYSAWSKAKTVKVR